MRRQVGASDSSATFYILFYRLVSFVRYALKNRVCTFFVTYSVTGIA